jgi:hypothetical protein
VGEGEGGAPAAVGERLPVAVGEGVPDREGVAAGEGVGEGEGGAHAAGGAQPVSATASVPQKAPLAAGGGTASVRFTLGCAMGLPMGGSEKAQHSTPAVEARTTQLEKVPPNSTAATSPCRCGGTAAAAGAEAQQRRKPDALSAQARHTLPVSPLEPGLL